MVNENDILVKIYVLIDPRYNAVRYVGWTSKSLKIRLRSHLDEINSKKKTHKINWLRELHKNNLTPAIEEIESVTYSIKDEREKYWISYYGRDNLVNGTDGGEGALGAIRSNETLKLMSENTKKQMKSRKTRENLSEKTKQQWVENRDELLQSLKKRVMPSTWIENLSKAFSGNKNPMYNKTHSEDAREKIRKSRERNPTSKRGVKQKNSTSNYLGVYKNKNRWVSVLILSKKRYNLGGFSTETDCAKAYDIASLYFYGFDYKLNFSELREDYISYLNQYEILDIKDLRKVIKNYISERSN